MSNSQEFERLLEKYAEVLVKVGVNVQPGQPVIIGSANPGRGTTEEALAIVRKVTEQAYKAGASVVSVLWEDNELTKIRLRHGNDPEAFETWKVRAIVDCIENNGVLMSLFSTSPDVYSDLDSDVIAKMQSVGLNQIQAVYKAIAVNRPSWLIAGVSNVGWARMVFPGLSDDEAVSKLWDAIFSITRATADDPIAAWHDHLSQLQVRAKYLTDKAYSALHYTGPGTDLMVGMPDNHLWESALMKNGNGDDFTANLPTEEVYSVPHRERVNGTVRSTMPLAYGGTIIDDFSFTFKDGVVVDAQAGQGEKFLLNMLDEDEGSRRIGEVAIVPHSSPISQSGLLFYNTLFDENAACHIALGRGVRLIKDARSMSEEQLLAAGHNASKIHVDFMIGSAELNIDGIKADGSTEPVLRNGEWAVEV